MVRKISIQEKTMINTALYVNFLKYYNLVFSKFGKVKNNDDFLKPTHHYT